MCQSDAGRLHCVDRGDIEKEKEAMMEIFHGAGWQTEEILRSLEGADDFYCERMALVQLDCWSRGRVVLVGDAAYCPSAMTGMGTTCGIVGAYILAGEMSRHKDADGRSLSIALKAYEETFRPFMDQVQHGVADENRFWERFVVTPWGIAIIYVVMAIVSFFRLNFLGQFVLREGVKGWELPDYPELTGDIDR
ncbi:hypothetical protein EYZ11_002262 [Aspergillus tanneri]|uniref:FAD-binding domain-containing protein n=1 Tax=Aspergillus tanneri TaxID=1220188 RepID=A0A4S3JS01_9EURO|nr:uncharacterized protein ATNIH1004_001928 [Aspergillus tanneri]KAA8641463.1 hypothetical protein ATNIH1004_001928 [Aspergillus tanneri]THC98260.1 hypothetical protein EYZ11_002262 [Aspergillus tanneri]